MLPTMTARKMIIAGSNNDVIAVTASSTCTSAVSAILGSMLDLASFGFTFIFEALSRSASDAVSKGAVLQKVLKSLAGRPMPMRQPMSNQSTRRRKRSRSAHQKQMRFFLGSSVILTCLIYVGLVWLLNKH